MQKKSPLSSYIKPAFFTVLILSVLLIISFFVQNDLADITEITKNTEISSNEKIQFNNAIELNNFEYFNSIATTSNIPLIEEFTKYKNKIDIQTEIKSEYLFFSFLGLKPHSSILHNVYGSYSKNTQQIEIFPPLAFSIINFNKNTSSITLKNISKTIIPADKTLILLPKNIKIQSDNLNILLPNESKKYFITQAIEEREEIEEIEDTKFIESVNYGYKAKVMTYK